MPGQAAPSDDARQDLFALQFLTVAYFLSGSAALIYQVIWQRMLGLFAGADSTSAALVVGAFLLGLGIGSLAASYLADRLSPSRAIIGYAVCEAVIALFAIASPWFFHSFIVRELDEMAAHRGLVFLVCFAGLLLPTFLMGMSTPLIARAVVVTLKSAASRIGLLYGANTIGAGAGALAGGWWLAGKFGFQAALWIGAALNLAAVALALVVVFKAVTRPASALSETPTRTTEAPGNGLRPFSFGTWCVLTFLSGFFIIALEIVWVRVLGIGWQQTAYSFSFILAVFLVADGAGLAAGGWITHRIRDSRPAFFLIQASAALHAIVMFIAIPWLYSTPPFAEIIQPEFFRYQGRELLASILISITVVAPPAFLLGMSFPLVQHAVQRDLSRVGQYVGLVHLANILGNAAGSIATGLFLLTLVGSLGALKLATLLAALLLLFWGLLSVFTGSDGRRFTTAALPCALAAILLVLVLVTPSNREFWSAVHQQKDKWPGYVAEDSSGLAFLRVEGSGGKDERSRLFIGGYTQSHIPFFPPHLFLGAVGPLIHPAPHDILVIGVGSGGSPYGAGVNPETKNVTAIELIRPVYDVLRAYASTRPDSVINRLFQDPRYRLITGDGRREIFVKSERYDLIQSDAVLPESSNSGVLYSREFFELARDALKPGGYYVLWAPTRRNVATFTQVFPHVVQLRPASIMIGSMTPIDFDPEKLAARLAEPAIRRHLADGGAEFDTLRNLFALPARIWSEATPRPAGEINTDLFPRDEFYLNNLVTSANAP